MKMHICIRNNDGTHYQIYGDFYDMSIYMRDGVEVLDASARDFDNIRVEIQGPSTEFQCENYTSEFLKECVGGIKRFVVDWHKFGSKLSING